MIELSPAGQMRERAVRCYCGTETWNWSARCDDHLSVSALADLAFGPMPDPHDHARDEMLAERYER